MKNINNFWHKFISINIENMKKYILPICVILLTGCYYDKADQMYPAPSQAGTPCDTMNVTYTADIKPIMDQNCALSGCHDATTKSFGYDLSSYNGSVATANSGRFLGVIRHDAGFIAMPKGMAKLDNCSIQKIAAWINAGTPQ